MIYKLKLYFLILLVYIPCISLAAEDKLEVSKEDELRKLFQEEKYVITLFSEYTDCSGKCDTLESSLVSVREDLVEGTGGWVIRAHAPSLAAELGVKGSSIIFVRDGRPLLYTGPTSNEEVMLEYLLQNKAPIAHNLTDSSFEHETQAGTGATTGDWLVMFTRSDCPDCTKILPSFEAVGVNLKGRKNIAILDREYGSVTARRFGVKTFPAFILFRLGKLYRFDLPLTDVGTLTSFAQDGFRNTKGEPVPHPKSPFDDFTEACADWLREFPGTALLSLGGFLLAILFLVLLNRPPPESWTKKSKKKKN